MKIFLLSLSSLLRIGRIYSEHFDAFHNLKSFLRNLLDGLDSRRANQFEFRHFVRACSTHIQANIFEYTRTVSHAWNTLPLSIQKANTVIPLITSKKDLFLAFHTHQAHSKKHCNFQSIFRFVTCFALHNRTSGPSHCQWNSIYSCMHSLMIDCFTSVALFCLS